MEKDIGYRYKPERPPKTESVDEVLQWALQELEKASIVINNLSDGRCAALDVEPKKPRDGMIRKADGTNWDPGDGRGYYGFDEESGLWLPLGVAPP